MTILFASDHAGIELKNKLVSFVRDELGYAVDDLGAYEYVQDDDYPDLIAPAAKRISENPDDRAIIIGGSGQGEAIVANRFPRVRAAVFQGPLQETESVVDVAGATSSDPYRNVVVARQHNDANVLSLAARFLAEEQAREAVQRFLATPFTGEDRHARRIRKIEEHTRK